MPRPLIFPAKVMVRLRDEDRDRIGKVLQGDEVTATFVRDAALRELAKRERVLERQEARIPRRRA